MPSKSKMKMQLLKHGVSPDFVQSIIDIPYKKDGNQKQDFANYAYKALNRCEEVIDFDTLCSVMSEQSCCRTGKLSQLSRQFGRENDGKSLEDKIKLLTHISRPIPIGKDRYKVYITGENENKCSCSEIKGCRPVDGKMPLSYCMCCAGFCIFHYKLSLGLDLKIDKMVSSFLNGDNRCCVILKAKDYK